MQTSLVSCRRVDRHADLFRKMCWICSLLLLCVYVNLKNDIYENLQTKATMFAPPSTQYPGLGLEWTHAASAWEKRGCMSARTVVLFWLNVA